MEPRYKKIENVLKKLLINIYSKKLAPGLFPLHYSQDTFRINVKKPKRWGLCINKKKKIKLKKLLLFIQSKNIEEVAKNIFSFRKIKNDGFKGIGLN